MQMPVPVEFIRGPPQDPGDINGSEPMEQDLLATPEEVKDDADDQELSNALRNKLKLRHQCIDQDLVLRGLRIRQDLSYMDASVNSGTHSNVENILKRVERGVCKALIGYYRTLEEETKFDLETVERKIRDRPNEDPSHIPINLETFRTKLEKIEHAMRNSLEKRWINKLTRLTPHSRTKILRAPHAHTHDLQERRHSGAKGYAPYETLDRDWSRKGKGPTSSSLSLHMYGR